jgi:gluconate 2-dehydrogenase gamma chain
MEVDMDQPQELRIDKPQNGKTTASSNGSANGEEQPKLLSRREFLKAMGLTAAGVASLSAASSCNVISPTREFSAPFTRDRVPVHVQYPAVPYTPAIIPDTGILRFFTPHEARTVEAFTARLLPGTPEDPGAREAGVVFYIDNLMSYPDGFAEPIYRRPPFAAVFDGDEPPGEPGQVSSEGVIWVPAGEIERYGYQSIYTPREVMRMGLAALDRFANEEYDDDFADLSEEEQDEIIEAMVEDEDEDGDDENEEEDDDGENGEEEEEDENDEDEDPVDKAFAPLTPMAFFRAMIRYTNQGFFSDPLYGGNRNMVGWRLIGYPGAQRAYSPGEIQIEGIGLRREPWSMANLPPFNPGQPVEAAINPVTGSDEHDHHDVPSMPDFHQPYQEELRQPWGGNGQINEGTPPAPPSPNNSRHQP